MATPPRRVLIVTPFFAPESHAAVFRAYKLAKYLPEAGWEPHVLTVDTNYQYNEDQSLLEALPPSVTIHRARYVEPTRRGLSMLVTGRNETFLALKRRAAAQSRRSETATTAFDGSEPTVPSPAGAKGAPRAAYGWLRKHVLRVPDDHWPWYRPAVALGKQLLRSLEIPVVLSTAPPFTSHLVGRALSAEGARWVCDLRDPEAFYYRTHSESASVYAVQRWIEQNAVRTADAVTVAAESIGMILTDMYGLGEDHPIHFIPTGLDHALKPDSETLAPLAEPYLVFSGEYLEDYGDAFLRVFADALREPVLARMGIRLLIIGYRDINRPRMWPHIERLGLEDTVDFLDHVPQQKLYHYLAHARAAVIQSTPRFRWWCLYAKLVDYIALQKTVVALVPDPSEARKHLQRTGLGVFLDGSHQEQVRTMAEFLSGTAPQTAPVDGECSRFMVSQQVASFAKIFDSLVAAR